MVLLYKIAAVLILWPGTGSDESSGSNPSVTRTKVDLIELNHFLDVEGREVFQQLIFYDWCPPSSSSTCVLSGWSKKKASFRFGTGNPDPISVCGTTAPCYDKFGPAK